MAREITRDFVLDVLALVGLPDPIVEFGSLQVEPEQNDDLRATLAEHGCEVALGTDFRPGPGVDRVEDLRALSFADGEIGTAICLDTLEHCEDPWTAVRELHRVVRPDGGLCLIASVMRFPIHGYPDDFFRFTPSGFAALLAPFDDVAVGGLGDPEFPQEVFGVGRRGRSLDGLDLLADGRLAFHQRIYDEAPLGVRIGHEVHPPGALLRTAVADLPRYWRARRTWNR